MKFFLVSIGLVLAVQYACACVLQQSSGRSSYGSSLGTSPFDDEENICEVRRNDCVPLVVRPRDVPRPSVSVPVLNPIPGPCSYKKAIVKPAVLPKPVYLSSTNVQRQITSSGCASNTLIGYGGSFTGGSSGSGSYVSGGSSSTSASGGSSGTYVSGGSSGTYVSGGSSGTSITGGTGTYISGNNYMNQGTPADAVSLNLAYKLARQQCAHYAQSEDKLAFGFKKLPTEVPQKRVVKINIPEEQIYSLNGQIVELKPVSSMSSQKSLDEEAAEDLLAMEAEEYAKEMEQTPIKKLYLEEIGYGPAKTTSAQFVDIPVSDTIVQGDATSCGCSKTQVSGCGCCKSSSKCKGYLPGDVSYKIAPKFEEIVIQAPEPEDSCESAEINISQEQESGGCECQCHCTPVCVHTSQNKQLKKSSVFFQRYQG